MSIRNSRGARRLTAPTAQALIDVRVDVWIIDAEGTLHERAHEKNAPTRRVVLVAESEIRRTGLEAEPAVDAGHDPRHRMCERCIGKGTRWPDGGGHPR